MGGGREMPGKFCGKCGTRHDGTGKFCGVCSSAISDSTIDSPQSFIQQYSPSVPGAFLKAKSHLKINLEGTFKGDTYKIIGRIKYSVYDKEDKRSYLWDEWLLISRYGRQLWLSEDEWKFQIASAFTPKTPFDPNSAVSPVMLDDQPRSILEKGKARIEHYEGELNYKPETGEEVNFLDLSGGYSVEWNEEEIKFFKSEEIVVEELYKAFNLDVKLIPVEAYQKKVQYEDEDEEIPRSIDIRDDNSFYHYDAETLLKKQNAYNKKNVPFLLSICGVLLILFSLYCMQTGKMVFNTSIMPIECKGGKIVGPIKLTKAGTIHVVRAEGSIAPNNIFYDITMELIDEEDPDSDIPLWGKEDEFWGENGVEYEEGQSYPWSETSASTKSFFLLSEEGDYYLRITTEGDDTVLSQSGSIRISIYEGVILGRYYFWAGFLLILIAIFIF